MLASCCLHYTGISKPLVAIHITVPTPPPSAQTIYHYTAIHCIEKNERVVTLGAINSGGCGAQVSNANGEVVQILDDGIFA
jgi:hypothetical protein